MIHLLLIMLTFNFCNSIYLDNDYVGIFKKSNINPYIINNNIYRESTYPIYTLNLKQGNYNFSDNNYKLFLGRAIYGEPYFKDYLLKPTKITQIASLNILVKKNTRINVMATVYNILPNVVYEFKLYHNNYLIHKSYGNNFEYFGHLLSKGNNVFSLYVLSQNYSCLCPSIDNGFKSGYQLSSWLDIKKEINKIIQKKEKNREGIKNYKLTYNSEYSEENRNIFSVLINSLFNYHTY
jgi:hypothetical protein